ncbi:MAG TPA: hypothetical protein VF534_33950 [Paraburkholderia sp.]
MSFVQGAASGPKAVSIRHLPVNLFASVMGLSGLALAWEKLIPH